MAKYLGDIKELVRFYVQDSASIVSSAGLDKFVKEAVDVYSSDRPQTFVSIFNGDGGYEYILPSSFEVNFSQILEIEYPYNEQEPVIVDEARYLTYQASAGSYILQFKDFSPAATEKIRMVYSARHSVVDSASSISDNEYESVAHLSAAYYLRAMANYFGRVTDSTIGADAVDYHTKSDVYDRLSKEHERIYRERVPAPLRNQLGDWDTTYAWKEDFLFHKKYWR